MNNKFVNGKVLFMLLPWIVSSLLLSVQLYLNPHHYAAILRVRGDRYVREGDIENALKSYNSSLQYQSNHYFTWVSLGALREQLGDIKGAVSAFAIACNLDPTDAVPQYHLARLLTQLKKFDHALDEINGALDVAKNERDREAILTLRTEILGRIEKSKEAQDIIK